MGSEYNSPRTTNLQDCTVSAAISFFSIETMAQKNLLWTNAEVQTFLSIVADKKVQRDLDGLVLCPVGLPLPESPSL